MISDRAKEILSEGVSETENRNLIFLEEGGQSTIFRLFRASEQAGDPEQRAIRWLGMAKGLCRCARGELQTGMIRSRDEMSVMATVSGTAICRAIVEAHGGWLRDHGPGPEPGPCFTLTPPQGARERTPAIPGRGASASPMQRSREGQLRVLAVDPDPVSRSHTWTMLLDEGFEAVVTGDPDRVEYLAGTERPHLFLVDAGPEIMERIARESDGPVLFMLEHGTVPEIERALGPGSRRLHPQALHPAGACGENQDGRAERTRTRSAGVPGTIRAGRADHRLRGTHGNRRQRPGPTDGDRVQPAIRALHERGVTLTHEHLLREVWGPLHQGDVRVLRTFIKGLRRKLGDAPWSPRYIYTAIRVGYRMPSPSGT